MSDGVLYGIDHDALYRINSDGTGYSLLCTFTNGYNPLGIVLSGDTLYATCNGSPTGPPAVFRIHTNGTGLALCGGFPGTNNNPNSGLGISSGILYGTTKNNYILPPTNGIFRVNVDGTGFTNLYTFTNGLDGSNVFTLPTLSGDTIYGVAYDGGVWNGGTVYSVNTNGDKFTVLHYFDGDAGYFPASNLLLYSNTLYGTASTGGDLNNVYRNGVLFSVDTAGDAYTVVHIFTNAPDGAGPTGGMVMIGNRIYGITAGGGGGSGTIFSFDPARLDYNVEYSFDGKNGGYGPGGQLVASGNVIYGQTGKAIFAFDLSPRRPALAIAESAGNVILSWPRFAPNYVLQTSTGIPAGTWSNVTNLISTNASGFVTTNRIGANPAFYRLISD